MRSTEILEDRPVMVDGCTVARAIINHNRREAMKAAHAAASHVSTPDDIQICTFSDGSHSRQNHHGGVGMAYRRRWLPPEWTADTEDPASGCEDMVEQAWSYGHANGALVMEAAGILESLWAVDEEIKMHLAVLQKNASTVKVKITTDCQAMPEQIARTTKISKQKAEFMPPVLFKQMKEMITTLQGHGVQVVVEMHWSPRKAVPQMVTADMLAGEAMRSGLGYCTADSWAQPKESAIMKQLTPMLSGAVIFARSAPTNNEPARPPNEGPQRKKFGKRKAEDEMEDRRPTKKAKKSKQLRTMPASWGLDPEITVYIWSPRKREMEKRPVVSCPFVRKVEASTMETEEENVFVNDGVSGFSMAKPIGQSGTTRIVASV